MNNDQVSGTRSNRKGHRLVSRFAAAAAISVGVLGVSNIQSASAATPCAPTIFDSCSLLDATNWSSAGTATPVAPPSFGVWGLMMGYNSTSMAALFAMQQNDMLQAQTIFAQVSADASAQAAQRWQTMQTSQTNLFAVAQDVTAGAALRATASWSLMDAYLR